LFFSKGFLLKRIQSDISLILMDLTERSDFQFFCIFKDMLI